ncbi:MAG: NifB/NifX family molybdenum-iron cluster-binding protein [Candidatus Micrarchaeia archaeon]
MADRILMAAIDEDGMLTGIGRAPRVAIIHVKDGKVASIEEIDVKWDQAHEMEKEGEHHANVARFIIGHKINEVIAAGSGPDMRRMLEKIGLKVRLAGGYYKDAIS